MGSTPKADIENTLVLEKLPPLVLMDSEEYFSMAPLSCDTIDMASITWWQGIGIEYGCSVGYFDKGMETLGLWILGSVTLTLPAILYTGNYGDRYWAMD